MHLKALKYLIIATTIVSLLSGIKPTLLPKLVSLSVWGIHNFFFWQFFTNIFIYLTKTPLNFSYLINLFFSMYLLYKAGYIFLQNRGLKHFLGIYFGSGFFISLIAYLTLLLSTSPLHFGGVTPSLFALVMATMILYPEIQGAIFLLFPIKIKWLLLGSAASLLLIDLSSGNYLFFTTNLTGLIYGYLYPVLVLKHHSPFGTTLNKIESFLFKWELFSKHQKRRRSAESYVTTSSRIYDFQTGEPILSHKEFIAACETKISKEGKKSLSLREKLKLWRLRKKSN